ncbi:hypothetical protein TNCV_4418751 [Trichonephila clavipes]|nr:hypothetical protein TNCV_4418751 [Trichonephila clavipes]
MSLRRFRRQYEQLLGPMDPRDVIYTKTMLRTPPTDQSSKRPPYRKKGTCTFNGFNGRHPGTLGAHMSSPPYEGVWLKDIWNRGAHYMCCP